MGQWLTDSDCCFRCLIVQSPLQSKPFCLHSNLHLSPFKPASVSPSRYCPLNDADIPTVKHLKKKRSSAGRLAGGKNLRAEMAAAGFGGYVAASVGANGSLGVVDPSIIAIGPKGGKKG